MTPRIVDKVMTLYNYADCLIVGAGIAGLVAGCSLHSRGFSVLLLDKGRGVGGRLATRNFDGGRFDYGAQFFTARDPAFRGLVDQWLKAEIVAPWSVGFPVSDGKFKDTGETHYRGVGGMRMIAEHLARDVDVRSGVEVTTISIERGMWKVRDLNGNLFSGNALILTPPVPQSLALLEAGQVPLEKSLQEELSRLAYDPCISVLATLDGPSSIPAPGGIWFPGEPLAWVADNTRKGTCSGTEGNGSITLHAGADFSRTNWNNATQAGDFLLQMAAPWLGARVKHFQIHRWRFSRPKYIHHDPVLSVRCPAQLVFAGDAFGGQRVEGAVLSGLAAAACL
jgi:renalase